MARLPRLKVEDEIGWYHICARVAGRMNWFPFEDPVARRKLLDTLRQYLSVYFCETAGFCLMGNHYHLVVRFLPFRRLSHKVLYEHACVLYQNPEQILRSARQWERFNRRLFDLSSLMNNLQAVYAKWYNRRFQRRGAFWGERYKSVILGHGHSILDTLLYVELNPVRAGLVERPEDWQWNSAALRATQSDQWLIPLEELLIESAHEDAFSTYRAQLYYRGAVITKQTMVGIPERVLRQEQARGFSTRGAYRFRLRFFTEGLFIGTRIQVEDWITDLKRRGCYLRRKNPVVQKVREAVVYTLRKQRRLPLQQYSSY